MGLPGARGDALEVPEADWPRLLAYLARQRITGLAEVEVRAGTLVVTEPQRAELDERHRAAMAMVLLLDHLLEELSSAMAEAGVPTIVLKGPAVASTFYPDRAWRSYGDLDLLVAAEDWQGACEVLVRRGFRRIIPEPRPGFDERFGKGASFEDARKLQVDLHRTLAMGPFGLWIDPGALLTGTTDFSVRDMPLRRLDDPNALIHACIHAALGRQHAQLVPLRDVLQIGMVRSDRLGCVRQSHGRLAADGSGRARDAHRERDLAHSAAERRGQDPADAGRGDRAARSPRVHHRSEATGRARAGRPVGRSPESVRGLPTFVPCSSRSRRFLEAEGRSGTLRRRWMVPVRWAAAPFRRAPSPQRRGSGRR